ncbi:FkbM family methyltransferase [Mesorhizobium sp.]|uniref:FkbM family methyltransferase n=1 Tax=Mesorhizobium sp. TaxID=1871066 RepID=UPI000FE5FD0A|nr:FkbM family methyltransferase [Mesorhizobium sp.]RWI98822.1 MAG: FkbM family methyltransferase [Mesorhizobium sp.]TIQ07197.1 MAG: FkbM family methyltransferase [Mesorhizobium sp.]TIR23451.1 MAG: FkbM family methyltransferase [Mesorhizobium sp.]
MITSYAQNFEDVILWRALKSVQHGFYIDVGAQDPVVDSVSLSFYERGWRGVHIEPSTEYAAKLRHARPDERVIQVAVGQETNEITFFEIPNSGLSTGEKDIAQRHETEGFAVRQITVPCQPLSKILNDYRDREVHWLKIDVEGMENAVIESWTPSDVRPWIVVVESTAPLSTKESHESWDPKLKSLGYDFAYFDGLNRFYVSTIHLELKAAFGPGPNFFDGFVLSRSAPFAEPLNAALSRLENEAAGLAHEAKKSRAEAERDRRTLAKLVDIFDADRKSWQEELSSAVSRAEVTEAAYKELEADRKSWQTELGAAISRAEAVEAANLVLRNQLADSERNKLTWEQKAHEWWTIAERTSRELRDVYASRSWRITRSYRQFGGFIRTRLDLDNRLSAQALPRTMVRAVALVLLSFARRHHWAKVWIRTLVSRFPRLEKHLLLFALHHSPTAQAAPEVEDERSMVERNVKIPRRRKKLFDSRVTEIVSKISK